MFAAQEGGGEGLRLEGVEVSPYRRGGGVSRFDLTLTVAAGEGGLVGGLEYSAEVYGEEEMRRLARHYVRLLGAVVEAPVTKVGELELMGEEERRELVEWRNRTRREEGWVSLAERVREQARMRSGAVALRSGEEELSYGELERRANQVARRLRREGVGPEARVGLLLGRTVGRVVGMLGVLKAGGAYVALDPEQPEARQEYELEDAGVEVLLAGEGMGEGLSWGGRRLELGEVEGESEEEVEAEVRAGNLAYVVYTSGSTGRPKGVMAEHRGLSNLVSWAGERYGLGEGEVSSWTAGVGFDASVLELWPNLVSGGRVELGGAERLEPREMGEWLEQRGVTVAHLTTPWVEELLREGWGGYEGLRQLLTGSDRLVGRPGGGEGYELHNHYGPTETTVIASAGRVSAEGEGSPGIGEPVWIVRVYVLGEGMELKPEGAAGELYVGGEGVTRGYVGKPGQTAERYLPEPWGEGGRLYRTGDLVRWRGGELEYLGRVDEQVKVRGYRVEPGEVEAVLREHPLVREAVVVGRRGAGGSELVAYVVGEAGAAELRQWLGGRLPGWMQPGAWVELEELPRLASGKVDRRALPEARGSGLEGEYQGPRGELEEVLSGIYGEVLGLERVSVGDSFF